MLKKNIYILQCITEVRISDYYTIIYICFEDTKKVE